MVDGHQSAVRPADLAVGILQAFESLGRGHLVHKVTVYAKGQREKWSREQEFAIPIYSKQVPSSCSLTMWSSKTLSYKVLGLVSAEGILLQMETK